MIVVNLSNWHTGDLEKLLECVIGMEGFKQARNINDNTILLFNTCRKKKWTGRTGRVVPPPPVSFNCHQQRWANTLVVSIGTAARLKMDVLDRLAGVGTDCIQDMSSENVVKVAESIANVLSQRGYNRMNCSWAAYRSLRVRTDKVKPSPILKQREIEALVSEQEEIRRGADRAIQQLQEKIRKLRQ